MREIRVCFTRCDETGMKTNHRWPAIGCYYKLLQRHISFCKIIIDLVVDMLEFMTVIIVLMSLLSGKN